ncbi:MAG: YheU family protein [Acidobacteria bacterium]|nr:YheU family protein [Acidobacteriota bacterium]
MEVPYESLSSQALEGLIESFVLREGTDYGHREFGFEEKVKQVKAQLQRKEALIVFDPDLESATILSRVAWKRHVDAHP